MKSVFLCHATRDKPLVRRIAHELERFGIKVWLDEREIRVGDSLREKIEQGLTDADYVVIALSKHSLSRPWVQKEINAAFAREISSRSKVILPALLEDARIPLLLQDKVYADFSSSFENGIQNLLKVFLADLGVLTMPTLETIKCHVLVDIMRIDGSFARHTMRQTHRCLFGSTDTYIENYAADGELTDFKVIPGKFIDIRKESVSYHLTTQFPKLLSEGETIVRTISFILRNSFIKKEEYWDQRQFHPSENVTVIIRFPKSRPPIRWSTVEREGSTFRDTEEQAEKIIFKGKPALKLFVEKPRYLSSYIIRWEW